MAQTYYLAELLKQYGDQEAFARAKQLRDEGNEVWVDAESIFKRSDDPAETLKYLEGRGYKIKVNRTSIETIYGKESGQKIANAQQRGWNVYDLAKKQEPKKEAPGLPEKAWDMVTGVPRYNAALTVGLMEKAKEVVQNPTVAKFLSGVVSPFSGGTKPETVSRIATQTIGNLQSIPQQSLQLGKLDLYTDAAKALASKERVVEARREGRPWGKEDLIADIEQKLGPVAKIANLAMSQVYALPMVGLEVADSVLQTALAPLSEKMAEKKGESKAWERPLAGGMKLATDAISSVVQKMGYSPEFAQEIGGLAGFAALHYLTKGAKATVAKLKGEGVADPRLQRVEENANKMEAVMDQAAKEINHPPEYQEAVQHLSTLSGHPQYVDKFLAGEKLSAREQSQLDAHVNKRLEKLNADAVYGKGGNRPEQGYKEAGLFDEAVPPEAIEEARANMDVSFDPTEKQRIPAVDMSVGDSLTFEGEKFKVIEKTPDGGSVIKDGVTVELGKNDMVNADPFSYIRQEVPSAEILRENAGQVPQGGAVAQGGEVQGGENLQQQAQVPPGHAQEQVAPPPVAPPAAPPPAPTNAAQGYQPVFPDVDASMKSASGLKSQTLRQKAAQSFHEIAAMRHTFEGINPSENPQAAAMVDMLRRQRAVKPYAEATAINNITRTLEGLSPDQKNLFTRKLILDDIQKNVEDGMYDGKEIPFSIQTPERLQAEIANADAALQQPQYQAVNEAFKRREELVRPIVEQLVEIKQLPEAALDDPRYYHRQVLKYMEGPNFTKLSSPDVRMRRKGFQQKRTGAVSDWNTRFEESEFDWMSKALQLIETQKTIDYVDRVANIGPQMLAEARMLAEAGGEKGPASMRELPLPEGYVLWQPSPGHYFYKAYALPERMATKLLTEGGETVLKPSNVREVLAVGGNKPEYVIPKNLANVLDKFSKYENDPIEKFNAKILSTWKQWVLINPVKVLKYNLNNMSGDADIVFAYDPKALKYIPQAVKELSSYNYGKKGAGPSAAKMEELIRRGVIDSGISIAEIPDVTKAGYLQSMLKGENVKIGSAAGRYFDFAKKLTNYRENILRVAAWDYFGERMKAGKRVYGVSKQADIDGMYDMIGKGVEKADIQAKLARELVGDYGAISEAGQWIRRQAIPFYSWIEINAPRYVRLFKNLKAEQAGAGDITRAAASAGARLAAKTGIAAGKAFLFSQFLWGMTNLWNKLFFPEEEKQLQKNRRELHLIYGADEDGQIHALRFSGALADALQWFNANDWLNDIEDWQDGKVSAKDLAWQTVTAPVERTVQAIHPVYKIGGEAVLGQSFYPNVLNKQFPGFPLSGESKEKPERQQPMFSGGRPIRDRKQYIARMLNLDYLYDKIAHIPRRPMGETVSTGPLGAAFNRMPEPMQNAVGAAESLFAYKVDPGEAAYYFIRERLSEWMKETKEFRFGPTGFTDKANALFYYKQAIKFGDNQAADYWLKKYGSLGGAPEGVEKSYKMSAPLGSLNKQNQDAFMKWLTPEDRDALKLANQWYYRQSKRKK